MIKRPATFSARICQLAVFRLAIGYFIVGVVTVWSMLPAN
jgi:hypothetical protein